MSDRGGRTMGREESPSTKKEKCIGKYGWGRAV